MAQAIKNSDINLQTIVDFLFPIGYIWYSTKPTNPQDLYGGKWQQKKDVFLLCAGDRYKAGEKGGEEKHQLTIGELPKFKNTVYEHLILIDSGSDSGGWGVKYEDIPKGTFRAKNERIYTDNGSDIPHNNMPPYETVYAWERIG